MKWSSPFFDYHGPMMPHGRVQGSTRRFGFWKGALVLDAGGGRPARGVSSDASRR